MRGGGRAAGWWPAGKSVGKACPRVYAEFPCHGEDAAGTVRESVIGPAVGMGPDASTLARIYASTRGREALATKVLKSWPCGGGAAVV